MKYLFHLTLWVSAALLCLVSCSKPEGFALKVKIDNLRNREVRVTYFDGVAIKAGSSLPPDGVVMLAGSSPEPTLVHLSLPDGSHLASLIVANGDEIEMELDADAPYKASLSGSEPSKRLLDFFRENEPLIASSSPDELNLAVARYIGANPGDIVSTALLVSLFSTPDFEQQADSLLRMIAPEAKSRTMLNNYQNQLASQLGGDVLLPVESMGFINHNDSLVRFTPSRQSLAILAFLDDGTGHSSRTQDIAELKKLYERYPRRRFAAMEFTLAVDSLNWQLTIRGDSVGWQRVWMPALLSDPKLRRLAVPRVPFFIVVDSVGNQLLRTPSLPKAVSAVTSRLD